MNNYTAVSKEAAVSSPLILVINSTISCHISLTLSISRLLRKQTSHKTNLTLGCLWQSENFFNIYESFVLGHLDCQACYVFWQQQYLVSCVSITTCVYTLLHVYTWHVILPKPIVQKLVLRIAVIKWLCFVVIFLAHRTRCILLKQIFLLCWSG